MPHKNDKTPTLSYRPSVSTQPVYARSAPSIFSRLRLPRRSGMAWQFGLVENHTFSSTKADDKAEILFPEIHITPAVVYVVMG